MKSISAATPLMLDQDSWNEILRILSKYISQYTVWAFGSRVTGKAKPYSDLDLVIYTDESISLESMAVLNEAFDESDLPIRVDVVDWAGTTASFREIIQKDYLVIQQGGSTAN